MIVLVAIRRLISGQTEPPVRELLKHTNIIQILIMVFTMKDETDPVNVR